MSIAKILEGKPKGTRLYSLTNGDCFYEDIDYTDYSIICKVMEGDTIYFSESGKFDSKGECLLLPSKEMRDWSKFSWKKGDILVDNEGKCRTIFVKFVEGSDYTKFYGRYLFEDGKDVGNCEGKTSEFTICSKEDSIKFIHEIERICRGKFDANTLSVVKFPVLDLKNGDFVVWTYPAKDPYIGIFNKFSALKKKFSYMLLY